jgi:hypothetical protein
VRSLRAADHFTVGAHTGDARELEKGDAIVLSADVALA